MSYLNIWAIFQICSYSCLSERIIVRFVVLSFFWSKKAPPNSCERVRWSAHPLFFLQASFCYILLPKQKYTHRQCCALCKGFQHYSGERCHFVLHRTMVSAAVIITSTVTNPTVNQIGNGNVCFHPQMTILSIWRSFQ